MTGLILPALVTGQESLERTVREQLNEVESLRNAGEYEKGFTLVERAMETAVELQDPALEVEAHYQTALLYYFQHDYPKARAEMEIGLARARVHELKDLEADFLSATGVLEWKQGNLSLALPKLQSALAIREASQNWVSMASISNNLGIISYTLKDYEEAAGYYRQGLNLLKNGENRRLEGSLLSNLAEVLIPLGKLDEAEANLQEALRLELDANEPRSLAYTYFNLGELHSKKGNRDVAISYFEKALSLQTSIDDKWAIALSRLRLAQEQWFLGDAGAALSELNKGHDLAKSLNALSLLQDYADLLSEIYDYKGDALRAKYHAEQRDWMKGRIQLDQISSDQNQSDILILERSPENSLSTVQTATIVILGIMILILILENARLRNRSKSL
jgi:tetratricopeptide (TPR) repeat protein